MGGSSTPIFLAVGVGALYLATRKKKKRRRKKDVVNGSAHRPDIVVEPKDLDESSDDEVNGFGFDEKNGVDEPSTMLELLESLEDAGGLCRLGGLYQIKQGDTLLEIAREALYGTREVLKDPEKRKAVVELAIRIDCSPWNQTVYGRKKDELRTSHPAIAQGLGNLGVSFDPIYQDNRARMAQGLAPSALFGHHFAYIWIPQIDIDLFDSDGIVSIMGQDWDDTPDGRGHSKIDPPRPIIDLKFDDVTHQSVGCHLPDGDFRRTLEAYG